LIRKEIPTVRVSVESGNFRPVKGIVYFRGAGTFSTQVSFLEILTHFGWWQGGVVKLGLRVEVDPRDLRRVKVLCLDNYDRGNFRLKRMLSLNYRPVYELYKIYLHHEQYIKAQQLL